MRSILSLALCLTISAIVGQDTWELAKDKNGIRVYTRTVQGSNFKALRAVTEIEGEVSDAVEILKDIKSYHLWMAHVNSAEVVAEEGDVLISYMTTDMPLTLADRDGYYQHHFQYDERANNCLVNVKAIPDYAASEEGYVRIPHAQGFWKLSRSSSEEIKVVYEMHSDPGGSIPGWATTSGLVSTAVKTMSGLRDFIFVKSGRDF